MSIVIVPSKLTKPLKTASNQSVFLNSKDSSLYFSSIKGPTCILNCYNPADLNIFYKIVSQSFENKELNIKLSTHCTSFLHLALQVNSKSQKISSYSEEPKNLLNFLEIENTVCLNRDLVYQKFFNIIQSNSNQCLSFSSFYCNQFDFMLKNQKLNNFSSTI